MKVLFMNWKSFGNEDLLDAFAHLKEAGEDITVIPYPFENTEKRNDPAFEERFLHALEEEQPAFVFSFNYYPLISKVCNVADVKYVAWVYDCPHIALYSFTLINKCNYVFVFDSAMYETFARQGIETVYYLPLAASVRRLDALTVTPERWREYQARISFVGSMYTEAHTFYERMEPKLDAWTRGYLEGLMAAQMKVDGMNFIEDALTKEVQAGMQRAMPMQPNVDGVESAAWMYAQYVLNRRITQTERTQIMRMIGEHFPMTLYTRDRNYRADGVRVRPPIDYYDVMPYVFKCSDINLNVSLRSITKGIPLRIFDILGAGGFVLTNFQPDLLHFFVPDEDFVYYESREDLIVKIDYYLKHEEERLKIAKNGHDKVAEAHTYDHRLREILDIVLG